MARKRNIHPGFFKNEDIADLEPLARLLFIGMWNLADREGRLEDRPKKLRVEILPYDNCDGEELASAIANKGFIIRYEVDGNKYIQINNFLKYQDIHPKESASIIPPIPKEALINTQGEPKENPGQTLDSNDNSQDDSFNPYTSFPSCTSIPSLDVVVNAPAREDENFFREIMLAIQRIKSVAKPEEQDLIADMIDHYPRDWLIAAIEIAVNKPEPKVKSFNFVDGILANWRRDGFKDTDKPWEGGTYGRAGKRRLSGSSRALKGTPGAKPSQVDWKNEPEHL